MLPTVAPVWGRLAELAVVAAKFVLAGRADAAGNLQGVAVERSAADRGRALCVHPAARMRGLEGGQAAFLDVALAAVPVTATEASGRDAAQLL
eukprot:14750265-Alexandrium_andersonii.AAC.1